MLIIIPGFFFCLFNGQSQGMFAVMLNYILSITTDISDFMDAYTGFETSFISFERCYYFMNLEPEKGYTDLAEIQDRFDKKLPIIPETANNKNPELSKKMVGSRLEFIRFSCRYRAG